MHLLVMANQEWKNAFEVFHDHRSPSVFYFINTGIIPPQKLSPAAEVACET